MENVKWSSSLLKIHETGINVFKSNYQIIKNKKIKYEISTIDELRMRRKIIDDYCL